MSNNDTSETNQTEDQDKIQMLSKDTDEYIQSAPEDIAAYHFQKFFPIFAAYVDKLPLRAVKRLCKSIVAYPLEDLKNKHTTELEREALLLGEKLLQSKYVMFMTNLNNMAQAELAKESDKESNNAL